MTNDTPYRAPNPPGAAARTERLVVDWTDTESLNRWKRFMRGYYAFLAWVLVLAAVAIASLPAAAGLAVGLIAYQIHRRRTTVQPGFTLEVADETLRITRAGEAAPTTAALASVRDVEVERKSIQRVSYHQNFNEPVPSTSLSGDLDVARIVVVFDGGALPLRLTEEYAPVVLCLERFGKVRTFLRRQGWKPVGEREPG